MYNWEAENNRGADWRRKTTQRAKVKKTGMVVLHEDHAVDTSLERFEKEYLHPKSRGAFANVDDESDAYAEAENQSQAHRGAALVKAPLMTAETVSALRKQMGFTALLPCQAQVYRGIFKGRDVILHGRTGSGKTLAYALPVIERHIIMECPSQNGNAENAGGPFLLIFVFSYELAHQTKMVLSKVYHTLRFGAAGADDLTTGKYDVVIGTVPSLDEAIRGKNASLTLGKRKRTNATGAEDEDGAEEDYVDSSDDDSVSNDDATGANRGSLLDVSSVRCIVVDEVDLTLGPRFSNIGRRMKNLLKVVRHANGSVNDGVLGDVRRHHYVLCGATIPNWVVKAGFLGVKKYYYQLVSVGTHKLPDSLECFLTTCEPDQWNATAIRVVHNELSANGRIVVFGSQKQLEVLDAALVSTTVDDAKTRKGDKKKSTGVPVTCMLSQRKKEEERIAAIDDFNAYKANIILCTDLAARGLDFVDVSVVLMLSLPHGITAVDTFIHRAGRTARVGKPGKCILISTQKDAPMVDAIRNGAHAVFKRYVPGTKGEVQTAKQFATYRLKVKGSFANAKKPTRGSTTAFGATPSTQTTALSAEAVLKRAMGDSMTKVTIVGSSEENEVTFTYPISDTHEVQEKLWKYDVKEVQ